ncbi:MAG: twin-arginine translocation signal domain-containing protein, partial [Pirellulaceae bacterium]
MNPTTSQHFTRRRFLETAATAAAVASYGAGTAEAFVPGAIRENDHFWFRLAPPGPYIDSQRGHKAFGFGDGQVFLS